MNKGILKGIKTGKLYILFVGCEEEWDEELMDMGYHNNGISFVNMALNDSKKILPFIEKNFPRKKELDDINIILNNSVRSQELFSIEEKLIYVIYKALQEDRIVISETTGVDFEGIKQVASFSLNYCNKSNTNTIVLVQRRVSPMTNKKNDLYIVDSSIIQDFNRWYSNILSK